MHSDNLMRDEDNRTVEEADEQDRDNSNDPWINRTKNMRCVACMYFVEKGANISRGRVLGRCRRHAPTMTGFPVVFEDDWCGDHKINENAI